MPEPLPIHSLDPPPPYISVDGGSERNYVDGESISLHPSSSNRDPTNGALPISLNQTSNSMRFEMPSQIPPTSPTGSSVRTHIQGNDSPHASPGPKNGHVDEHDFSPTDTPTPSRPLLFEDRILVYPMGHRCPSCVNTGFKHYDPSKRCKCCWRLFSKPYQGPYRDGVVWKDPDSEELTMLEYYMLQRPLPSSWTIPTKKMGCFQWARILGPAIVDMNLKLSAHLVAQAQINITDHKTETPHFCCRH